MANIYSYKQLEQLMESFSAAHLSVQRFYSTVEEQIGNLSTEDSSFPAVFMTPISTNLGDVQLTQTVRIWCFDRLEKDRSNFADVISDTQQILNDFRLWFGPDNSLFDQNLIMADPTAIPQNNALMDYCFGWYIDVEIQMQGPTLCEIPLDPAVDPVPAWPCFPSEPLGFSGASGYSGFSGSNGTPGLPGKLGLSGHSGFSGVNGTIGLDGASGVSGYSGAGGTGASGFSGYSGYSGTNGTIGLDGASGFSGYSGVGGTGASGFSGYSGTNGTTGASGFSGVSGVGASGVSGYSGIPFSFQTITVSDSATPTLAVGTNQRTIARITGLAQAVTSFTTNFTATPAHGNIIIYELTDNGVARALTWGASFTDSGTLLLPTTTVISTLLRVGFMYDDVTTTWVICAVV